MKEEFSEARYYDGFKEIRNKIRKFHPQTLISTLVSVLHEPAKDRLEYIQRQPWSVLLIIKWVLLDEKFEDVGRRVATRDQAVDILNKTMDLTSRARMPTDYKTLALFLRVVAYQQFLYQRRGSAELIGRQILYFNGLPKTHYIPVEFHAATGIELDRFLLLSQVMYIAFVEKDSKRRIGAAWFSTLERTFPRAEIEQFLRLFATPFDEMRRKLLERDAITLAANKPRRSSGEYYEQTPFLSAPLIANGHDYTCIDLHLMDLCLGQFVYQTLRERDADTFMPQFGPVFERYVRRAVEYSSLPFKDEREIKNLLPKTQGNSLIDFLVADGDAHIFIDAKAVEMNYRGKVTHDSVELKVLLRSSVLKAIKQAHSVLSNLEKIKSLDPVFSPRARNYLVVVTYGELYLGGGRGLGELLGPAAIGEIQAEHNCMHPISASDMYFLTIEEFERFSTVLNQKRIGLAEGLERAKHSDAKPEDRFLTFEQHLASWGFGNTRPDYVVKETLETLDSLKKILRD